VPVREYVRQGEAIRGIVDVNYLGRYLIGIEHFSAMCLLVPIDDVDAPLPQK
jgi:hypothetical protein